jgi:hypothetical protein
MVAMKRAISEFSFLTTERRPMIPDAGASCGLCASRGVRGERSGEGLAMKDAISGKTFGNGNI